ncbi:MAG: thiamine pyrophosphate-binding protein [Alphaproteobacteria bacterium]|mgnify:CR=1 FL=1|nr:thiamine pyrophosphate-binding protein [Alphaproteobacteria bacterium]MDP6256064.1 thiamine pyrophosphate-binding protein [Alphaproteobacteria bacterium]MDP7054292.1 thiamine pyrophosphate-binding protein [Alphaproteobacteria bacterium]MDP7230589.1 thiamine pyrophosphate-binding protein [Alphaproteobacteria bacterium]MDP7459394.1 thiamine pyrophosphate-binding protein [Alphaproteobacteria bacterium]
MRRTRLSFGERLIAILKQEGVEVIFSQGDLSMKDIQLHAEAQGLKVVGPRHEASAIFMAMGYHAMTGKVQVAIGAPGPGQANLLPAAITAAQEHIPVIIFGARRQHAVDTAVRRGRWLYASLLPNFKEVCKFAAKLEQLSHLDEVVHEAFRQALSGTPGPVYIEYDAELNERSADFPSLPSPSRYRAPAQPAPAGAIEDAHRMLRAARAPILLAGAGVQRSRAQGAFVKLAHRLKCPVLTTLGGAGAFPETEAQWLRYMGQAGGKAIAAADLLLVVGTCLPETANYGRLQNFAANDEGRQVILIEPDAAAVGVNRPIDLALIGQIDLVLAQLLETVGDGAAFPEHAELEKWRKSSKAEDKALMDNLPRSNRLHPGHLMIEARKAVPEEAVIVVDGGLTMLYQYAFFEKQSAEFIYTANFGHLGSGMGLAIGAQLAAQSDTGRAQPVCLISGDGALGFHIMDFETAVRHSLPIVIVLNDDQALGAEMAQHMQHIGHEIQVTFSPVNYAAMAEAMGGIGIRVERREDIAAAVKEAFTQAAARNKPAIVQVPTDQDASYTYPVPYVGELAGWKGADVLARI